MRNWAAELHYDEIPGALLRRGDQVRVDHPFASELSAIFEGTNVIGASSVLCIDRVPTVCLVDSMALAPIKSDQTKQIREFCEKLWNQNLARIVLVGSPDTLEAWSVDDPTSAHVKVTAEKLEDFSLRGLLSGEVLRSHPAWFDTKKRVDKNLLENISSLVTELSALMPSTQARALTASVIFVAYLEDRGIVSDEYRSKRNVISLQQLLAAGDAAGITSLYKQLQRDFNGDFLAPKEQDNWLGINSKAFSILNRFLSRTVLRSGQQDFWRYDFAHIPIELISGIYETFLGQSDEDQGETDIGAKRRKGAYYTPRLLADWLVDQAFSGQDPLKHRIFDGACGSGMLLTAAFRRLVRAQRAKARAQNLGEDACDFQARSTLLQRHIFGSDVDDDARRLTVFSLYLALLSELSPRDLETLRLGGHKLPSLRSNIRGGKRIGDFFNRGSNQRNKRQYTIFLSNPPWRELRPSDEEAVRIEQWILRQHQPVWWPRRQIAAAFAIEAANTLVADGRIAMLLPVSLFVSTEPSVRKFRASLTIRYEIERVTNFSDMRRLMFADAYHPFVVLVARRRAESPDSILSERFEYWTPKTDVALSFGRLTLHGADRSILPTSALLDETPYLGLRYWGTLQDLDTLTRLRRYGRIADLQSTSGWLIGKGFHLVDNDRRIPKSRRSIAASEWLKRHKFLKTDRTPPDIPIVDRLSLGSFPYETIAREPKEVVRIFSGPRVLWPDGTHPENGIKAVFATAPFSFQHSIGVISAPKTETGRMEAQLLTAYMRSSMGTWLSLLLSASVAAERPKLHVSELLEWPFWTLENHPNRKKGHEILVELDKLFSKLEECTVLGQANLYENLKPKFEGLVFEYFDVNELDRTLIRELARFAGPSLQPTSLKYEALVKPLRRPPTTDQIHRYCARLVRVLTDWKNATNGRGELSASAWTARSAPIGGVVISLSNGGEPDASAMHRLSDDGVIEEFIRKMARVAKDDKQDMLTIPDLIVAEEDSITIIKPLVARFWLERAAVEDATKLASEINLVRRGTRRSD